MTRLLIRLDVGNSSVKKEKDVSSPLVVQKRTNVHWLKVGRKDTLRDPMQKHLFGPFLQEELVVVVVITLLSQQFLFFSVRPTRCDLGRLRNHTSFPL